MASNAQSECSAISEGRYQSSVQVIRDFLELVLRIVYHCKQHFPGRFDLLANHNIYVFVDFWLPQETLGKDDEQRLKRCIKTIHIWW